MRAKKVLIIGPTLPRWEDFRTVAETLVFLKPLYELEFMDSLERVTDSADSSNFFAEWHNRMEQLLPAYDAFIGFSLGGIIIQQCFDLFEELNKRVVFFSVPSFSDESLSTRLVSVLRLFQAGSIWAGVRQLNQFVFYPNDSPSCVVDPGYDERSVSRISFGLRAVLETDSRTKLKKTRVDYLHLIGERSLLVNRNNVYVPQSGRLIIVPRAGMRVLRDNPHFCVNPVVNFLRGVAR